MVEFLRKSEGRGDKIARVRYQQLLSTIFCARTVNL